MIPKSQEIFIWKLFNPSSKINVYCPDKKHEGYMKFQVKNLYEDRIGDSTPLPHVESTKVNEKLEGVEDLLALFILNKIW